MFKLFLQILFLSFFSNLVFSQGLDVVYPAERMVIQRNNANAATINIAGNYRGVAERIDVKLNAIQGGQSLDWITIQTNPTGGIFKGVLNVSGGWYSLEVRQIASSQVIASTTVQKFGVGEVFIIAGQSNAQGYQNFGNPPAFDDRVNYINNYFNGSFSDALPPYPGFGQLVANAEIAPFGQGSWVYGRLGDLLAQKLNVPILFINAAWEGSAIDDWLQSANGGVRFNVFTGTIYPRGMPFANLKNSLQYYTSLTGFRSIIWHQGESDQFVGTSGQSYQSTLQRLIQRSREITGKNISWLVCRASKYNAVSSDIINAQTNIVFNTSNVFLGPNTDDITERVDGVHFGGGGLVKFADRLNASLNDQFFAGSIPHSANSLLNVETSCNSANPQAPIQLTMQGGFRNYSLNQFQGQSHAVGQGFYRGQAIDQFGNYFFTPEIRYQSQLVPIAPTVLVEGSVNFCPGNEPKLYTSNQQPVFWSDQFLANSRPVLSSGTYFGQVSNEYGCSAQTNSITVQALPSPAGPDIFNIGATSVCPGQAAQLSTNAPASSYLWSDGSRTKTMTTQTPGDYNLKIIDLNGCISSPSSNIRIGNLPLPVKPVIIYDSLSFCPEKSLLIRTNSNENLTWSNGQKTQSIRLTNSEAINVTATNAQGCSQTSEPVNIQRLEKPTKPLITIFGASTYCKGSQVTIESSPAKVYRWSNGNSAKSFAVNTEGTFTVTVFSDRGCISDVSDPIQLKHFALVNPPKILADSLSFCPGGSIILTSTKPEGNVWSTGATTKSIKVEKPGDYSVKVLSTEGCDNSSELARVKVYPAVSKPTISYSGKNTICEGDTAKLQASVSHKYLWSNNVSTRQNPVLKAGTYRVTAIDKNGCTAASDAISIATRATPSNPRINQIGSYTLEGVQQGLAGDIFDWRLNSIPLEQKISIIKATKEGDYELRTSKTYSLAQNQTLTCYSQYSPPYKFILNFLETGMSVYPNPSTDGIVYIETKEDIENATISVIDLKGKVVFEAFVEKMLTRQVYDFSILGRGLYIIQIEGKDYIASQRVLLEN